jgi:hypothetical protein
MHLDWIQQEAHARAVTAMLEAWGDEAGELLLGMPGQPGNPRRAMYVDRWIHAVASGRTGPFDPRFGPLERRVPD